MDDTLGQLIRKAREATHLTREQAAPLVGKSTAWIGEIERDRAVPTMDLLLRMHEKLATGGDACADLSIWFLKWLEAVAKHHVNVKEESPDSDYKPDRNNREVALTVIGRMFAHSTRPEPASAASFRFPTLRDFPRAFENLLVVCGDRRESPPKNRGDLFVDSFSSADLANVKLLFDKTGPLEIRSDKYFALKTPGNDEFLKSEYGRKNLIVIGSPAVNLLARSINTHCVFRFQLSQTVRDFLVDWDTEFPEISDRKILKIFWDMASKWRGGSQPAEINTQRYYDECKKSGFNISREQIEELARKVKDLLKDHSANYIKSLFRKAGFLDPVDVKLQGFFLQDDNDFGVISLCPNPYADDPGKYFCILAAGIHAPGTYMALKALADGDFESHPLGGVIEVKLDREARWIERFPSASMSWQTSDYKVEDLITVLGHTDNHTLFDKCDPAELYRLLQFVKPFASPTAAHVDRARAGLDRF